MKKTFPYILIITALVGFFNPTSAHAGIWTWVAGAAGWSLVPLLNAIFYVILQLVSLILWLSGSILNFVMNETVVKMAENIKGMTGINIAWKVVRDLMNIAFIFLLVYEGILMIVGHSDTNKLKKFVIGIVIASLLINFSLFFTKIIIDASNIVTIGLYNSILVDTKNVETTGGLSNAYQSALGTQGFLNGGDLIDSPEGQTEDNYNYMVVSFMASLLFLITAFVFFAISVMFVVRYIILILLLILSPVAYMGMALLPGIKKHSDDWWETLWGQVLFGPIFMLMTWIVLTLMTSGGFTGVALDPNEWPAFASNPKASGSIALFFNFAIIIGLTIASLVTAKKFATQGSSMIGKFTAGATVLAGGAILGGTARLGRSTLGRYGNRVLNDENSEELKRKAAEGNVGARMKLASANFAAKSSFDVRATKKFGFDKLSKATGIDFGKADAKKENYIAIREEEKKAEEEAAKRYKPSEIEYEKAKADDEEEKNRMREELKDPGLSERDKKALEKKIKEYKENEKALDDKFKERTKKAGDRVANKDNTNGQAIWRYTANILGGAAHVIGIPGVSLPKSKKDRESLARKIRAAGKPKSKEAKLAEAAKAMVEEESIDTTASTATPASTTPAPEPEPPTI